MQLKIIHILVALMLQLMLFWGGFLEGEEQTFINVTAQSEKISSEKI